MSFNPVHIRVHVSCTTIITRWIVKFIVFGIESLGNCALETTSRAVESKGLQGWWERVPDQ